MTFYMSLKMIFLHHSVMFWRTVWRSVGSQVFWLPELMTPFASKTLIYSIVWTNYGLFVYIHCTRAGHQVYVGCLFAKMSIKLIKQFLTASSYCYIDLSTISNIDCIGKYCLTTNDSILDDMVNFLCKKLLKRMWYGNTNIFFKLGSILDHLNNTVKRVRTKCR